MITIGFISFLLRALTLNKYFLPNFVLIAVIKLKSELVQQKVDALTMNFFCN